MEFSRPRPSILSLFDPLSLTPDVDRTTSPHSDKENDTSDFFPSGTHKHIHVPPRTLKRRLVDVGDTTVEHPDMHALLADELEQELSYIVNDDDNDNDTLTFRDIAKAATPKWNSRSTTALEMPKASPLPRTPLAEILQKDELPPLARKKPYKHHPVSNTPKGSQSACRTFPPFIPSDSSSGCPPLYAEVPEVKVNDEPVPQSSSITSNSLEDSSELLSRTLNQSTSSSLVAPAPSRSQARPRHLSPTSPTDNANRYSVDLQTSFQIHFPSHDTTFDLLKDKVSFFGSKNEFDSFFNNLEGEGDSSLDDILIPGPESEMESESGVSSTVILNQAQSVVKRLIDHPTPVSKDVDVNAPSKFKAGPTNVDVLALIQRSKSNQIDTMPSLVADTSAKTTFVQHAFQTPSTSPPLPLVADNSRPLSTPSSSADRPRQPPPQIPALRIVKRSKTITQQKPSIMTKDGYPQDALIPVGSRVPVTEVPVSSSLPVITKKGHPSEVSQVQRTDKVHLPPPLVSNGPRRVLISEGPKLNPAPNTRANLEQVKHSNSGPRRVAAAVPPTAIERASSSARPPIQPSSGVRQPVKYGTSVVRPVQRTAGSRLPAITRRIGIASGAEKGLPRRVT